MNIGLKGMLTKRIYVLFSDKTKEDPFLKDIARDDDNALVVFFDKETKLHPCIVQKKDGSFLYSTSDFATIKYRKNELNVAIGLYIVDERQQEHFKQVFEIAKMTGTHL